jgi:hypothetical protein
VRDLAGLRFGLAIASDATAFGASGRLPGTADYSFLPVRLNVDVAVE